MDILLTWQNSKHLSGYTALYFPIREEAGGLYISPGNLPSDSCSPFHLHRLNRPGLYQFSTAPFFDMRAIAIFAALLAVAYAAPSALEARQQGEGCDVCIISNASPIEV